ncbi:hypothetical protein SB773_02440 [Bacillus sp. SIMBA_074]|uniref:hypothetical protein n=1 Tax=Bacillus TaxID=1386 RepID=UPI0039791E1F
MTTFKVVFNYQNSHTYAIVKTDKTLVQLVNHFGNKLIDCKALAHGFESQAIIVNLNNVINITVEELGQQPHNAIDLKTFKYYSA